MAADWSRLTRHAKKAVHESQVLAASLGNSSVEPEHLMLSLLDDRSSSAVVLLALLAVDLDRVRMGVEERLAEGCEPDLIEEKPAYSKALRQVVEDACRLAGSEGVGTEHLAAAALLAQNDAGRTLRETCQVESADLETALSALDSHELRLPYPRT